MKKLTKKQIEYVRELCMKRISTEDIIDEVKILYDKVISISKINEIKSRIHLVANEKRLSVVDPIDEVNNIDWESPEVKKFKSYIRTNRHQKIHHILVVPQDMGSGKARMILEQFEKLDLSNRSKDYLIDEVIKLRKEAKEFKSNKISLQENLGDFKEALNNIRHNVNNL